MYVNKQMTDSEIAKELDCDRVSIVKYRDKYNIPTIRRETELQKKLTKEVLLDLYVNKKMTDKQIAKQFNCGHTIINSYRMQYGIQTIDRTVKLTKDKLMDLYVNKKMTDRQIAEKFGCAICTVGVYRAKYGIETMHRTTSVQQQEVYDAVYNMFIQTNKKIPEIVMGDKASIAPFEIDIFIPEYNFGIEFNGGFWHSEIIHDKMYHYNKSKLASEKGIFIYHIFSYEWENETKRQKIQNQIKNLLGLNEVKIYARKCEIREVSVKEKTTFLDFNHVQGNDHASVKLGLYYNDELVSLMTFAKPRFSNKYTWELSRFCSKAGCNVIGGASKLFKYFVDNYMKLSETVVSYSDIAKTKGNLYANLGFTFLHVSDPNYIWWKNDSDYKTRYQCQMKNEIKIMSDQKYYRVYDCGNKVWVYVKNETR